MPNKPIVQHVITKNLLKQFANSNGFVLVEYKTSSRKRQRHINAEGFIPDFIILTDDAIEAEAKWNEIEKNMKTVMDHIDDSTFFYYANDSKNLKRFVALHLVRSFRMHQLIPYLTNQAIEDTRSWLNNRKDITTAQKAEMQPLFEQELPRQANNGSILKRDLFQLLEEIGSDFIKNYDVQIGIAETGDLIIGDNPVITFNNGKMEIDAPLKQTDVIFMPLSPKVVVVLPSKKRNLQEFRTISSTGVKKLNNLSRSAAYERIYLGPA